jgi:hypothetical protein
MSPEGSAFINDVLNTNKYQMLHIFGDTDSVLAVSYGTKKMAQSYGLESNKIMGSMGCMKISF